MAQTADARGADEAAVLAIYQKTLDAWNAGDGFAFAGPMAIDADFIAFDGTRFKGRDEIGATIHCSRRTCAAHGSSGA